MLLFAPARSRLIPRVRRILAPLAALSRDPRVRELLLFCLPALVAGLALRAVLTAQMPYGFFHDDTPDFLTTPEKMLAKHDFEIHPKKTFLVPFFFTVPFLLHVPALLFIPAVQHLLGLTLIVMIGLLCRLWFTHWKWFIVPATLVVAVNPAILWYEHVLMAESLYAFCTVLLAVAGTLYIRGPSRARLIFLLAALVLLAGARPEGKLMFGFGLLLVLLAHWGDWRRCRVAFGSVALTGIVTHFLTHTAQAGLLLYTSLAHLTPSPVQSAPDLERYIAPLRAEFLAAWQRDLQFAKAKERSAISDAIDRYLKDHPDVKERMRPHADQKIPKGLARETLLRNPLEAARLAGYKFRYTATGATNGDFSAYWIYGQQSEAMGRKIPQLVNLRRGLTGRPLTSLEEIESWVHAHYPELAWFNTYSARWHQLEFAWRFPDLVGTKRTIAGVTFFHIAAWAGMLCAALRRSPTQKLHVALGLALVTLLFTISLTANVKPRFHFVFEPFWWLYILLAVDCVVAWCVRPFSKARASSAGR